MNNDNQYKLLFELKTKVCKGPNRYLKARSEKETDDFEKAVETSVSGFKS